MKHINTWQFVFSLAVAGLVCLGSSAWAEGELQDAVALYRDGKYAEAEAVFSRLHSAQPENTRATYYLALSSAQLGRFQQARKLYEEVILLAPTSHEAQLAQQGLSYLPPDTAALDLPPRFEINSQQPQQVFGALPPANPPAQTAPNGMSMQDMMMMQMMFSQPQQGSGGNAGFNPLPFMMMSQQPGQGGMGSVDPNLFSTMMMNQMMPNFDFSNDKDH